MIKGSYFLKLYIGEQTSLLSYLQVYSHLLAIITPKISAANQWATPKIYCR